MGMLLKSQSPPSFSPGAPEAGLQVCWGGQQLGARAGGGAGAPSRGGRGRSRRAAPQLPGSLQRGRTRGAPGAPKGAQRGRLGTTQVSPARGLPLHRVLLSHDPARHPLPLAPPPWLRCTFPSPEAPSLHPVPVLRAPLSPREKINKKREASRCGAKRGAGGQGEGAGTYSAKRGAKRSGRETQARLPVARNPAGGQAGQALRTERRRGQGRQPHGRAGGVGSAGARTALGPRLRAARLPAPLWLLGTNSGQSHDAGAARSASLPGAGGVSRGWEPGWEGQGGAAGAAAAAGAGRGPHPLGWRQPPEGSASHWQTRTPPCPSPPPPPAPPPPAPRPVTRGRPDRHSLFPGAGRRPAGSTCPARRGAASGLGVSSPRPASPPWASTRPSAPPRALLPEPAPRPGRPGRLTAARALGGRKGGAGRLRRHTARGPAAPLPKHTARAGCAAEEGERRCQSLAPAGRAAPPGRSAGGRWSGVSRLRTRVPGVGERGGSERARCPGHWVALLPVRWRSVFRNSGTALVLSPALQG